MKFHVIRYAVLQEDEGHEGDYGVVEADSEAEAISKVLDGSTYFSAGDFYAYKESDGKPLTIGASQAMISNERLAELLEIFREYSARPDTGLRETMDVTSALQELSDRRRAGWLPIATAPKSARAIICGGVRNCVDGYHDVQAAWIDVFGNVWADDRKEGSAPIKPAHWMPAPEPSK